MATSSVETEKSGLPQTASPTPPKVLIAIVNYCTARLTIDCLTSLQTEIGAHPGSEVVVADNASPDGSGEEIARAIRNNGWSAWARVLPLAKNGGFAFGNNAVILEGRRDPPAYVWLLNSDTYVRPGALRALVDFLEANPAVGMAGSRLEDPDGTQQVSTFRFPSVLGEIAAAAPIGEIGQRLLSPFTIAKPPSLEPHACDWLSGASLMIRWRTLDEVGLMDEKYFLYYEETDLCLRAQKLGWTCWFVPESRVVHLIGASTGVTARLPGAPGRRPKYWFDSRRRYFVKNYGMPYAALSDVALVASSGLRRLVETARGRQGNVPPHFESDLIRNSALVTRLRRVE
jgi:hypothetical protein